MSLREPGSVHKVAPPVPYVCPVSTQIQALPKAPIVKQAAEPTVYSPDPNFLERRFAAHLLQHTQAGDPSVKRDTQTIARVTHWVIALAAVAGIISGGLIGGTEIWTREFLASNVTGVGWRATAPYWAVFFLFTGLVSAVEIALLYMLALGGATRIAQHSQVARSSDVRNELLAHGLARAALEFPNPQIRIFGIDPYAYVANWKLLAFNLAYKLKVGVSSFVLRVFLRRVAARMAIRGMVPLMAGPLYALWNGYILWRIMREARIRSFGPLVIDKVICTHYRQADSIEASEKTLVFQAIGEMIREGRDAHPNQICMLAVLTTTLSQDDQPTSDQTIVQDQLAALSKPEQDRILDLLTLSCLIGARIHRKQRDFLKSACSACDVTLDGNRLTRLRKAFVRGHQVTASNIAATRMQTA